MRKTARTRPAAPPAPMHVSMTPIQKALMTKELSKAQAALWLAISTATQTNNLDFARSLRTHYKAIGDAIVALNGGPALSLKELLS